MGRGTADSARILSGDGIALMRHKEPDGLPLPPLAIPGDPAMTAELIATRDEICARLGELGHRAAGAELITLCDRFVSFANEVVASIAAVPVEQRSGKRSLTDYIADGPARERMDELQRDIATWNELLGERYEHPAVAASAVELLEAIAAPFDAEANRLSSEAV